MIRGYDDVYPSVVEGRYAAILIHHPERVEGEVPRTAGGAGDKLSPLKNPKVYKVELTRRMRQFHPMEATVYILRCRDGSYYTGLTKQPVEARLWEHNAGIYEGYTSKRLPVELVFTET